MSDHRYPIGKFELPATIDAATTRSWIEAIEALPREIAGAVERLDEAQLATPYREGGWTVRQVVHHLADSHINAYVRCKLAATEACPVIKPYEEGEWAELADGHDAPVELSIHLLSALHSRWSMFLWSLSDIQLDRTLIHPVSGTHTIRTMCGLYAWHGRHHAAHVTRLRERMGW
ncbi:MAG: putative metal-dependent hydrolase [Acidobacteria bacterium]|nr:putative metal-dependent hydrolase [Acidobacteriota bacterium]